jgi:hypothetical protein
LRIRADITVAEAVAAALVVLQLSPFEPPQQKQRTSPAGDCGRENVKPSTLRVCHHTIARGGVRQKKGRRWRRFRGRYETGAGAALLPRPREPDKTSPVNNA